MTFSDRTKLKALAIVHVFETSKPFGDYSACVVLKDGAGVSYGINQFTHRSGSLYAVVNTYLGEGGSVGADVIESRLATLKSKTPASIAKLSADVAFKTALKQAGKTPEMQLAQQQIMENMYLEPAIDACEGSHFSLPLSLAVVYDSINHGSFGRIRDRVTIDRSGFTSEATFEKAWIADYVRERHSWLGRHANPLLRQTTYRTRFFLDQIAAGNWRLDLPLNVHGVKLTDKMFPDPAAAASEPETSDDPQVNSQNPADASPATGSQAGPQNAESTPQPDPAVMTLPTLKRAWGWFGTLSFAGMGSTTIAAFNGLPPWAIFVLGMLTATIVVGGGIFLYQNRTAVIRLLNKIADNNADPDKANVNVQ